MTRVTSDVETLNELFSSGVVTVFGDLFTLARHHGAHDVDRLAARAGGVRGHPAGVAHRAYLFRRQVREAFRDIRVRLARLNSYLQEHLSGMRVVQLFGRERAAGDEFAAVNRAHLDAHLRSITIYAVFFPDHRGADARWRWRCCSGTAGCATPTRRSRSACSPRSSSSRAASSSRCRTCPRSSTSLQSAMASSERIFGLLDAPDHGPRAGHPRRAAAAGPGRGAVRGRLVPLPAGGGRGCCRDVSFTASPGADGGAGRADRGGEDHDHQPAAPLLRPGARPDHGGRGGHPRAHHRRAARGSSGSCSRTSSSSPATSCRTSASTRRCPRRPPAPPPAGWAPTGSSSGCPPGYGHVLGERGEVAERGGAAAARALPGR